MSQASQTCNNRGAMLQARNDCSAGCRRHVIIAMQGCLELVGLVGVLLGGSGSWWGGRACLINPFKCLMTFKGSVD